MFQIKSQSIKISNIFFLFLLTSFVIISIQQRPCSAARNVLLETMTVAATPAITVKGQPAVMANYRAEGKFPFCSWCCNPIIGTLCCKDLDHGKCV
ncbi:unnamed protein product [Linum trigynum]|uniref:Uncharacterized protein n=1 Tax=Linum trigynum TaxID=586398 RepID=A0AAV2EFK7_9ROSI